MHEKDNRNALGEPAPAAQRDIAENVSDAVDAVEHADVALGAQLASARDEPAVKAAAFAGKLGDQEPLYALSVALVVIGCTCGRARLAVAGVSMLAAVGAADAGKSLTKRLVKRTRPHVLLEERAVLGRIRRLPPETRAVFSIRSCRRQRGSGACSGSGLPGVAPLAHGSSNGARGDASAERSPLAVGFASWRRNRPHRGEGDQQSPAPAHQQQGTTP